MCRLLCGVQYCTVQYRTISYSLSKWLWMRGWRTSSNLDFYPWLAMSRAPFDWVLGCLHLAAGRFNASNWSWDSDSGSHASTSQNYHSLDSWPKNKSTETSVGHWLPHGWIVWPSQSGSSLVVLARWICCVTWEPCSGGVRSSKCPDPSDPRVFARGSSDESWETMLRHPEGSRNEKLTKFKTGCCLYIIKLRKRCSCTTLQKSKTPFSKIILPQSQTTHR